MQKRRTQLIEAVQRMAVRALATNPAGEGLCLIGGFRYRLLDGSSRHSLDLDYHWTGDLHQKQAEVIALFKKKLLPEIRNRLGYDGSVSPARGPDAESAFVRTVDLAVYRQDSPRGRIEIPVDITRIACADKPVVRTVDGVVYLSASDADMIESKVVALFARPYVAQRDLVDIFLFQDKFAPDAAERLRTKFSQLSLDDATVSSSFGQILKDRESHVRAIAETVSEQMEVQAASHIQKAGGAAMLFDQVMDLLKNLLRSESP